MAGLTTSARRLGRGALDLLFPPSCVSCGAGGDFLCMRCAGRLVPAAWPRCRRCWRPLEDAGVCPPCRITPPPFDGLRAVFIYDASARVLVHALKYRGMSALAGPMAGLMARSIRGSEIQPDVIVPVPLASMRRRTRGYNQAGELAAALGRELGLPVSGRALRRTRETPPQARSRDAHQRHRNVAGAFAARPAADRRVLLVDDVTTTGATLTACAGALRDAGAGPVWALAFARED
jgi:ComF family protein